MKENKYDEDSFFDRYSSMARSVDGLKAAGEWHILRKMLPDFQGKRVLDLGCGFGWHCKYAVEQGAESVIGIDISQKMIDEANVRNPSPRIKYICMAIEDYNFPTESFDVVISSLAFHYLDSFETLSKKINKCLVKKGSFVFSVEHPIFTASGKQEWYYNEQGDRLHWPVDRYFNQGMRTAVFLGEKVTKYHKTFTIYINGLISSGFEITGVAESEPSAEMLSSIPEMKDEMRRPMFLIIASEKK